MQEQSRLRCYFPSYYIWTYKHCCIWLSANVILTLESSLSMALSWTASCYGLVLCNRSTPHTNLVACSMTVLVTIAMIGLSFNHRSILDQCLQDQPCLVNNVVPASDHNISDHTIAGGNRAVTIMVANDTASPFRNKRMQRTFCYCPAWFLCKLGLRAGTFGYRRGGLFRRILSLGITTIPAR